MDLATEENMWNLSDTKNSAVMTACPVKKHYPISDKIRVLSISGEAKA
jgi:hypothetical protein